MMITTQVFACSLPQSTADKLNLESGRIYTATMVEHYRIYRHTGHWLSAGADEKLSDFIIGKSLLHAHSRDAAQQAFVKACKTALACQKRGLAIHYPHKRKLWRTTIWKKSCISKQGEQLLLGMSLRKSPIRIVLPPHLRNTPQAHLVEMRLVWDRAARHYFWHLVIDNGQLPAIVPGNAVAGVDLGEIHPATVSDGSESIVFSARQLRSLSQYSNKRLAELQQIQAHKTKDSKRWKRIQRRKNRFLAQQKRRKRDIEHKVSRAVIDWAVARKVGVLAVGDVRKVAVKVDIGRRSNQKISNWTHGKFRSYLTYKAVARGIAIELVNEAYTSQTCPICGERHKPKGRVFRCISCGFVSHRDAVGAANIRSIRLSGQPGKSLIGTIKYRHPYQIWNRSRLDTAQVARSYHREAGALKARSECHIQS